MILTKVNENQGGPYTATYYNLVQKRAYTFVHDEFAEVATEIPEPFIREDVEKLIIAELWNTETSIRQIESNPNPTPNEKVDLVRLKNNLNYLINYEHTI